MYKHHDVYTKKWNIRSNPTNNRCFSFLGVPRPRQSWVTINDRPPSIILFHITKLEHSSPITFSFPNAILQFFIYLRVRLQVFASLAID